MFYYYLGAITFALCVSIGVMRFVDYLEKGGRKR